MDRIRCPACNELMRKIHLAEVQLDECRFCDGLWFDRDEPEKVAAYDVIGKHLLEPMSFDDSRKMVPEGKRSCPRCGNGRLVVYRHRDVPVEVCDQCRGMFLERYELQKLLED